MEYRNNNTGTIVVPVLLLILYW